MGDLASTCKDKLAYFRIKELKDVLTHLSVPKHGKKQELVDRILLLLSDDQGQWHVGRGHKKVSSKEAVAKVVDDIYMKMQVHGPPDLLSESRPDFSYIRPPKIQDDSYQLDANVPCLCGKPFFHGNVVKCDDCQVQQHMDCVLIPEKPMDGARPEIPDHFYCQLCRLSRADPFWVTTGSPLRPMRLMTSGIANGGTNGSQSVDKSFVLSRAQMEIVEKAEYDIQVWCILLNDKVQFRMHWPQYAELQVNGVPVRVVPRPTSQLLGINGRDDGPVIKSLCREGHNKIFLSSVDIRPFCFGIRIARRRTVDQVLTLVPKEADGESFEDSLARVCRCLRGGNTADDADSDSDLEVVADFFPVSLRCPNSGSRIRTAGRFKPCAHMGSFDLQTFVELNQRSRKWQCPTCLKNYSIESMIIDRYFSRITSLLRNCSEDVTDIDVKSDGSWRVKGDVEDIELAQWHLPDGSLSNMEKDTALVAGDVSQFKKGGSDGSESSIIGNHRNLNLNGIWEVSRAEDLKPSVAVNQIENIEYNVPNFVPMSSSLTGIYRDGEYLSASECSMHFDPSMINGHELDSFSHKFGQMYSIDDRPQKQTKDADVIVLSDSDEENMLIVPPPAAFDDNTANVGGFSFVASIATGVTENHQEAGGVGGSGLGLFNDDGNILNINSWPMQSSTRPEQGFQFFGSGTDAADTIVDSRNSFYVEQNGYALDCNAGAEGTSVVQDLSTCIDHTEGLVDNMLPFGNDDADSSLRIFLPSRPASVPTREERNEHDNILNGAQPDDWISLTLAAGGGDNEETKTGDTLNPQPQIPLKETRMQPLNDAEGSLLSLNDDLHNKDNPNLWGVGSIFSHRQSRSVRPRLRLSIDSDSE